MIIPSDTLICPQSIIDPGLRTGALWFALGALEFLVGFPQNTNPQIIRFTHYPSGICGNLNLKVEEIQRA
jgi:hypothetical protein